MHDGTTRRNRCVHSPRKSAGLIYVSLADRPLLAPLADEFGPAATPQGFERRSPKSPITTNELKVWENNRECFHCVPRHPQYVKANYDIYEEEFASDAIRAQIAAAAARTQSKWAAGHCDHPCTRRSCAVSRSRS
jgi:Rieske 2Fe-2S family protein